MSSTPAERKKRYKKTLNLPKTSFPMRANLAQNEPQSRKRWESGDLYREILRAREGGDSFIFHDGPPFANGSIHVGHLLNKVLKDLVVRSRNLMGERCHFVPGWDCHGLPIEHKVTSEMVASGKMEKLEGLEADRRRMIIRRECQKYAEKFVKLQAEQMKRLLTLGDYADPYLTMNPGYEASVLEVFAELLEQGLVYRALKPVHWSIANRTALAEAELEYMDREDPSIYVHFEVVDEAALASAFGIAPDRVAPDGAAQPSLMIWTTTPWTLPANRLIAVHERHEYSLVRLEGAGGSRVTVLASELVEAVVAMGRKEGAKEGPGEGTVERFEVLATTTGSALVGLTYRHPLTDDTTGRVVVADYVTLEDGTGLVHTAPGHGQEDYETGLREGLEIYSPVRADGTYDDSVPEALRGLTVWDANPKIIESLRASGHLHHHFDFLHSYPHDWRSKTPVIFRGTEQWFIGVDKATARDGRSLREMGVQAAGEDVRFVPGWGRNRLLGMLESRPDWCISRQRAWGLPIPAFRLPNGEALLTLATVRAVAEVFAREGSDAWFEKDPTHLLASWSPAEDPDAPAEVDVATLEKMHDIFDVWLESGSSWNAVMRRRGLGYPVDLYLEGSDQHRGWFQLSMLPGLGATGEPPFRTLLTHGFMVDREGKKMSKSLGNALNVDELLANHGADVLRWWVSSLAFENDIKVDLSYFDLAGESYRKVRNTLRFLLSNLADWDRSKHGETIVPASPTSLDGWILARTAQLRDAVIDAYRNYQFRQAHLLLFDFCNDDLSAVYLDAMKDRLYCDRPDAPRRRRAQATLDTIAEQLIHLLAPILPHTADEAWHALRGGDTQSVHLGTFPALDAPALDARWEQVFNRRDAVQRALESAKAEGLENPLDAGLVVPDADGSLAAVGDDLVDLLGVSRVRLDPAASDVAIEDLREAPRCERSWRRDATVREREDGGFLSDRDADAVAAAG